MVMIRKIAYFWQQFMRFILKTELMSNTEWKKEKKKSGMWPKLHHRQKKETFMNFMKFVFCLAFYYYKN